MSAPGDDPVLAGRPPDRWQRGPDTGVGVIPAELDAVAGIARRLQARVDRHRRLLQRMQSDPLQTAPAELPELLETVARIRHDTESLLMLHGQDPGVPSGGVARRLSDVLAAAVAAAEEPWRIDIGHAPAADVAPAAATELRHILAEVLDHVAATHPDARVGVSGAAEAPAGVVVEVRADGAAHPTPQGLGGGALDAARRLAQRSVYGIVVRTPARAPGAVVSIHCPASAVTLDQAPDRALTASSGPRLRGQETPGSDPDPFAFGSDLRRSVPRSGGPLFGAVPAVQDPLDPLSGPLPLERILAEPTRLEPPPPGAQRPGRAFVASVDQGRPVVTNGHGVALGSGVSHVDELFGPMVDLPHDLPDGDVATPIFEAVASAWFREEEPTPDRRNGQPPDQLDAGHGAAPRAAQDGAGGPSDWETPHDVEWRAAAERAARPEPPDATSTGLPRRRPGSRLVPPPLGGAQPPRPGLPERSPDRVRDRLSTYQRGLRQGRHRADPPSRDVDPEDFGAW